jgi:addiction module HigA family antidote
MSALNKSDEVGRKMKSEMAISRRPTSPGEVLDSDFLKEFGITQEEFAKKIRVSRLTVNQIIGGKRSITAAMALRIARATATTPELWLNMQRNVDLYDAGLELGGELERIKPIYLKQ